MIRSLASSSLRLFIVIDALDECSASNGCRTRFLDDVFQIQALSGASVFTTSRPNITEITTRFQHAVSLEIRASDHDVRQYLEGQRDRLPDFVKRDPKLKEQIENDIVRTVDGMYVVLLFPEPRTDI